jgi:methyl-accepting chemotaxis protein
MTAQQAINGRRWTIRRRVWLGFGSVIALLFIAAAVGARELQRAHRDLGDRTRRVLAVKNKLFASQEATRQYVMLAQNDLLRGSTSSLARMDSATDRADSLRTLLSVGDAMSDAQRAHLSQIGALQGRIGTRLAIAHAHLDLGEAASAAREADKAAALVDSMFSESAAVGDDVDSRTARELDDADHRVNQRELIVLVLLGVGLAAAIAVGVFTVRAVTRPLDMLAEASRRLGEGNLRDAPDPTGLDEEYRVVAQALGDTTTRLSLLVREIQHEAGDVARAAAALTMVSDEAADSTSRVSATMIEIAEAAESQRRNVQSTRTVVERVQTASDSLELTATSADTLRREVRQLTDGARAGIAGALEVLGNARNVIGDSLTNVERVEKASNVVQQFLATIEEISDQSELLALNAAIEAARAGESGRGFSVVAAEMRKLAENSKRSAEEVRRVVTTMRGEVGTAVAAFRRGVGSLGDVDATSRSVTDALATIHTATSRMDDLATAVRGSAESNRGSVTELGAHVVAASDTATAQVESSQRARTAAEDTAAASEEVAATASELEASASRLEKLVAFFTTA